MFVCFDKLQWKRKYLIDGLKSIFNSPIYDYVAYNDLSP